MLKIVVNLCDMFYCYFIFMSAVQLLAYLKLGRRKEALQILADVVEDTPISRPMYLCADVVS